MNNKTNPWTQHQELKEISEIMDDVVNRAKITRTMIKKMGNKPMNENINSLAKEQLKGWSDAYDWAMNNLGKTITQWPPGWEVIENLEENTTVNMSPCKEAIQNAETPKKKSAKSKIEQLVRK